LSASTTISSDEENPREKKDRKAKPINMEEAAQKKKEARKARIKERRKQREEAKGGYQVEDPEEIQQVMADILRPSSFSGWLLCGYSDDTTVILQASGRGGVSEAIPHLKPDEVQYLLIRFPELKDGLQCNRDIFIAWTGPKASKIKAAKKATFLGEMQAILAPNHAQLTASGLNTFNEESIRAKSLGATGSHHID